MIRGRLALADGGAPRLGSLPLPRPREDRAESNGGQPAAIWEKPFVWLVWTTMLAIALAAVSLYASRIPYQDEWNAIVPAMTGQRPITLAWLWTPHNEHRLFIPRLIDLGLLKLSGGDFRIGSYFNLALLAAMAAGSIRAAQRIRGRASFTDAIFPLLLLHLRHFENIFMMFQNQVVVPVGCALVALFAAARYNAADTKSGSLVWCGGALLAVPLCGAYGLPIAFPSSIWLAVVAGLRYGRNRSDKRSLIAATFAAATLAICIAYLVGLKRTEPVASDIATKVGFVVNLLRFSVGISESTWLTLLQKSILLFVPLAIGLLVFRGMREPKDRARTAGVSAFFAGALAIPVAIASGRDPHLFPSRYFLHSALIPICVYVVFLLVEKDNSAAPLGRPILTTALFAAVLLLAVTSIAPLWKISADSMTNRLSFESGMVNEVPLPRLVAALGDKLFLSREYLYGKVLDLCREQSGAFRDYHPNAEFTVQPLPFGPATLQASIWDEAAGRPTEYPISWQGGAATISNDSGRPIQLSLAVGNPAARQVRAIRIHYAMDVDESARATTGFNLQWMRPDDHTLASETEYVDSVWHPRDQPLTLYIDDKIDAVSLVPLGPFHSVTISGIDLCLPVGELK